MSRMQELIVTASKSMAVIGAVCLAPMMGWPFVAPAEAGSAKPVIVDTDMAGDDWMAILYLLARPDVEVLAVTVAGTGEAHCKPGVRNAMGLLALAGKPDIAVACGRTKPLAGNNVFPQSWRGAVDNMFGLRLPRNPRAASKLDAVALLRQSIEGADDKVTLVTLGPLTNIAELLKGAPQTGERIAMIYVMGGAVSAGGNLVPGIKTSNRTAEWNIYVDPQAAAEVVESGVPVTLVALDATRHAPITMAFHDRLKKDQRMPAAKFIYQVLHGQQGFIRSGTWFFWDPMAAVAATDEDVITVRSQKISVVTRKGAELGRTKADPAGTPVYVAVGANRRRFETIFIDTVNGRSP